MKIKKGDLFGARDIIMNKIWLADYERTAMPETKEDAIELAKSLFELISAINDLTDQRQMLLDKYGKKNKYGKVVIAPAEGDPSKNEYKLEDKAGFDKGIQVLFAEEIIVTGLKYEQLRLMSLCPAEVNAISFLLI